MPKVYVIDDTSMNAFATGRDPEHASIAVTKGLLSRMDREEVQGVIGHELSHVRNFDIRFALLVGVLVGSIALLADFFLRFTFWGGRGRSSDSDRGGGGAQAIILAVAFVLAILAPIAARLVQLSVSRQREYLADASAVELTRNPTGLERALATIASDTEVLEVANRATQHLYFTNPIMKCEDAEVRAPGSRPIRRSWPGSTGSASSAASPRSRRLPRSSRRPSDASGRCLRTGRSVEGRPRPVVSSGSPSGGQPGLAIGPR